MSKDAIQVTTSEYTVDPVLCSDQLEAVAPRIYLVWRLLGSPDQHFTKRFAAKGDGTWEEIEVSFSGRDLITLKHHAPGEAKTTYTLNVDSPGVFSIEQEEEAYKWSKSGSEKLYGEEVFFIQRLLYLLAQISYRMNKNM